MKLWYDRKSKDPTYFVQLGVRNGKKTTTKEYVHSQSPVARNSGINRFTRSGSNSIFVSDVTFLKKEYGNKVITKAEDKASIVTAPATEELTEHEPSINTITATVPETEDVEQPKPQIPPRPVIPPEAAAFPRLQKIKVTLDKQNHLIFEAERERSQLEIKLSDLKELARLTKKKELESRIATKNEEIRTLKAGLSSIVRQNGFATVQDFLSPPYFSMLFIRYYLNFRHILAIHKHSIKIFFIFIYHNVSPIYGSPTHEKTLQMVLGKVPKKN